jgi:hypothetical protein
MEEANQITEDADIALEAAEQYLADKKLVVDKYNKQLAMRYSKLVSN